jgi:hypothetical protein
MNAHNASEIYRPSKWTWSWVLLGAVVFVMIGCAMIRSSGSQDRFVGFAGTLFFGICGVAALLQFLPNCSLLQVGPDGLTIHVLWRTTFYAWADIESFGVSEFSTVHSGLRQRHRQVGFNFSRSYAGGGRAVKLRNFNRRFTGFEAGLPDNYGRDCAELAEHLNRMREQYVGPSQPTRAMGGDGRSSSLVLGR